MLNRFTTPLRSFIRDRVSRRRLLTAAQSRFVRSRPGSVLILVVALLVLMALIGTAFMSMAQTDRATSTQHENNTEIDLLMDGLINSVEGKVLNELFARGQFRPALRYDTGDPNTFNNFTGIGEPIVSGSNPATWLASRLPELPSEVAINLPSGVAGPGNQPLWRFLTAPILGATFSSPLPADGPGATTPFLLGQASVPSSDRSSSYTQRSSLPSPAQQLYPSFMPMPYPGGPLRPVWVDNPDSPSRWLMAADADGDGVPDSGLFKLPIGTINGITYYAAVRIVDNNAAVNANVAWQHNPYISAAPTAPNLPGDFFPSNIDLLDMLAGTDGLVNNSPPGNVNQLLNFRLGLGLSGAKTGTIPGSALDTTNVYDDFANLRTDVKYSSYLEASWNGLGRRLNNPGFWSPSTSNAPIAMKRLSITDALSLATDFVLAPSSFQVGTTLQQSLPVSILQLSQVSPYSASPLSPVNWFNQNFGFMRSAYFATAPPTPPANTMPIRSILTTENGVSNFCPSKFRDLTPVNPIPNTWVVPTPPAGSAPNLLFGDSVKWKGHRFVCINPVAAALGVPPVDPSPAVGPAPAAWQMDNNTWIYQPWTNNPVKTAVNTASFGQLFLAYWSVMAEQLRPAPDSDWAPAFPPAITPGGLLPATPAPTIPSPRMFRNPIRVIPTVPSATSTWQLSPVQVMQLRAALAAVNTVDFRDGDDNVTARTVHLTDFDLNTQPNSRMQDVIATVYGLERQPFITKVYATNAVNNAVPTQVQDGYIAIELYNPDPVRAISLSGYALATITRPQTAQTATVPDHSPTLIPWGTDNAWFGANAPVIQAGGYLIVASSDTPPGGITLPVNVKPVPTGGTPVPGSIPLYVVHNLIPPEPPAPTVPGGPWGALGNELILVRPRYVDGGIGAGIPTATPNTTAIVGPTPLHPVANANDPQSNPYPFYHEGTVASAGLTGPYTPNPADMVPVDSYDFTGLNTLPTPAATPTEWYYVRPNIPATKAWHFVYPGHVAMTPAATPQLPRFVDGTWSSDIPPATPGVGGALGPGGANLNPAGQLPFGLPQAAGKPSYQDIPLQLNNLDFAGPNVFRSSSSGTATIAFPYGGFARNGDVLQVPFVGSYRLEIIDPPTGNPTGTVKVLEMNPVTVDSALALGLAQGLLFNEPSESQFPVPNANSNPQAGLNDPITTASGLLGVPVENVGRFCPLDPVDFGIAANSATPVNDFFPVITAGTIPTPWLYHFATRLFDYVAVQSPQQDYTPEAEPGLGELLVETTTPPQLIRLAGYSPPGFTVGGALPVPVANVSGGPGGVGVYNAEPVNSNAATEETATTEGLVNINSAPWRVLAAVPWVPPDFPLFNGTVGTFRMGANVNIGLSIAYYRDIDDGTAVAPAKHPHGPFKSIFELNNVPIYPIVGNYGFSAPTLFRNLLNGKAPPYNQDQGNITPAYLADNVLNDFKTKFTMMDRVSNLVTTRSDSFTAYVLLQGWRDAETPNASLAVQRRAGFLIDRSGITPTNPNSPSVNFVPNQ